MLSPTAANRNSTSHVGQNNLLAPFNSDAPDNPTNRSAPRQAVAAYQPGVAYQPALRQPYQSNPSYCNYQRGNKKKIYQFSDEEADPYLEGFYTILEQEDKEVQYSDERFDEVDTNFDGIETSCEKYGAPSSSKSRLHRHLKNSCVSSLQYSLPGAPSPNSSIPIITSRSVVPAMGSGLAF